MPVWPEELNLTVDLWTDDAGSSIERVLARCFHVEIARAAYEAALVKYPGRNITLRHGARVIEQSKPGT